MSKPSARDLELLAMPTIASQMPVVFANGAEWHSLKCECRGCGKVLPPEQVCGAVVLQNAHMVSVEASGVCHSCRVLTRYVYRLHDDMRITGPREDGWHTWGGRSPSLFQRVMSAFGR